MLSNNAQDEETKSANSNKEFAFSINNHTPTKLLHLKSL
jgi:hypothetical protein